LVSEAQSGARTQLALEFRQTAELVLVSLNL
jgi:hypothetical protein